LEKVVLEGLQEKLKIIPKKNQDEVNAAILIAIDLANKAMLMAQPFLIQLLPALCDACGDKKSSSETRTNAANAVKTITKKISPNALIEVLPFLHAAMHFESKWQTRVAALNAIASFGDHAPEQLGFALPDVIPEVSQCVVALKEEVGVAATSALVACCDVVGNHDIEHLTGHILRSIQNPEETETLMHELAGVRFVQSVESPALAMVSPLLLRGLVSSKTATVRQSAVILENMSKLVDDPLDAAPFLPKLLPVLEKVADVISDPEARSVAERSLAQLKRLHNEVEEARIRQQHIDPARVLAAIKAKFPKAKGPERYLIHIANLCCSLMQIRNFNADHWKEIKDHLLVIDDSVTQALIKELSHECEAQCKPLQKKDDESDDPALELCNCTFTLAYGIFSLKV
jgi:elongation factor 3